MIYTTDEVIRQILEHPETKLSADAKNALHGATSTHPWGKGKTELERLQEATWAIAGRDVHPVFRERLNRLTRKALKQVAAA